MSNLEARMCQDRVYGYNHNRIVTTTILCIPPNLRCVILIEGDARRRYFLWQWVDAVIVVLGLVAEEAIWIIPMISAVIPER